MASPLYKVGPAFDPLVGQVNDGTVGSVGCDCSARWGADRCSDANVHRASSPGLPNHVSSSPNGRFPTTDDLSLDNPNHPCRQAIRSSRQAMLLFLPADPGLTRRAGEQRIRPSRRPALTLIEYPDLPLTSARPLESVTIREVVAAFSTATRSVWVSWTCSDTAAAAGGAVAVRRGRQGVPAAAPRRLPAPGHPAGLTSRAVDDAMDLLEVLIATKLLARAERETAKQKLKTLPRMERAGIRLATAFRVVFDTTSEQVDIDTRGISPPEVATLTAIWERIEEVVPREELAAAIAPLFELAPPIDSDADEADGFDVRDEDVARLSPFVRHHINMHGAVLVPAAGHGATRTPPTSDAPH
ncbi:hypothetical protein ABZ814_02995 [Micromonospora musae]|uniref:hypothetical protein n=1 Tax=Micromonospora musae TaxID=1894970 RepID=UPI0033E41BCD